MELMKSSLNTFLNAITFPDKTFYPVSSRNMPDFINLMRVYMDAVLHPLIHAKPETFGQEGWHYELAEDGAASYRDVATAHKRLYRPSNSYIFLDGRVDIDQVQSILDGEFLSAYDRTTVPGPIAMQEPVDGGTACSSPGCCWRPGISTQTSWSKFPPPCGASWNGWRGDAAGGYRHGGSYSFRDPSANRTLGYYRQSAD